MAEPSKRSLQIVLASLLLLALAWQHVTATRLGYEVERARQEGQSLRGRIGTLQLELETSLSPAQLATRAKARLGMFPAPPEALRILGGADEPQAPGFLTRLFSSRRAGSASANG